MLTIMYRGDTRPPTEVFKTGFQPKKPIQNKPLKTNTPFEASSDSVSLSKSLNAAPAFPLHGMEGEKRNSWLYIVAIDERNDENKSIDFHSKSLTDQPKAYQCLIPTYEWAKEHIVSSVSPTQVLYAIPIEREGTVLPCDDETYVYSRFRVAGMPKMNRASTQVFLNNVDIQKHCLKIMLSIMPHMGEWNSIERPEAASKEKRKADLCQTAFFTENKFENEDRVSIKIKPPRLKHQCNSSFFKAHQFSNSSGVLFSSEQHLYKENANFFRALRNNHSKDRIAKDEKQFLKAMAESSTYYYVNCKDEYMEYADLLSKEIKSYQGCY